MPHPEFNMSRACTLVSLILVLFSACTEKVTKEPSRHTGLSPQSTLYEIYVPHWGRQEQLKAITNQALRIRNLGVTAVVLSPVQEVSDLMKLGPLGSPFAIKDHSSVRSMYGKHEDFKALVDTFHSFNIPVYMDWFPAMVGRDHELAQLTINQEPDSVLVNPMGLPLKDVLVLNYENIMVSESMCKAMTEFVKTYDLDGLRVFHDPIVPEDLYECFVKQSKAEIINAWSPMSSFIPKAIMDHELFALMPKAIKSHGARDSLAKVLSSPIENGPARINGISNYFLQNKRGGVYNTFGFAYKCMSVMAYMAHGLPMIEAGMELPVMRNLSMVQNIEIPWTKNMDDDFFRQLNLLVRRNRALHALDGVKIRLLPNDNENIIAIERIHGSHKVVGLFNLSDQTQDVTFEENVFNLNEHVRQSPVSIRKGEPFKMAPYLYLLLTNI
jgi:hypothetical protein